MVEILTKGSARVPEWVTDFDSFRRWTQSSEFPSRGKIEFLGGMMWIEPSRDAREKPIAAAVLATLGEFVTNKKLGRCYGGKVRLFNAQVSLATAPVAVFVSKTRAQEKLARVNDLEVDGAPDLVVHIGTAESKEKDTFHLPYYYHAAGVREYWLIKLLSTPQFTIYRNAAREYVTVTPHEGWTRSPVLGRSFRIRKEAGKRNVPQYAFDWI
jgi:Uma2 family endonuclease